jgi:hypothetical protein
MGYVVDELSVAKIIHLAVISKSNPKSEPTQIKQASANLRKMSEKLSFRS